jgi:L-ascorbate metabolism protein UlaG (beta-lactamase superfamily)
MQVYDTMTHEQLTYLGHSAFLITTAAGDILIDPFLLGNP